MSSSKHYIKNHLNSEYVIKKSPNINLNPYHELLGNHLSTSTEDYFYYRNFQIVKSNNSQRLLLGKGSFAEVMKVKSKSDGKSYAMKKIEKKKLDGYEIIYEEIRIHINLCHENIVKLFSFSETADYFYLIMELCDKGNLYTYIRQLNGLNEDICRVFFRNVIDGIKYLHSLGYTHRDIKPENILIDKNDNIKICDFGGAVKIEKGKERKTFFGTYEYMAPEIIEGRQYDKSVDIWALGILLYEMLHGYSPFRIKEKERKEEIKEYYQIYENIIYTEELSVGKEVSDEAAHLIKNLLIKDKTKRILVEDIENHPWMKNQKFINIDQAMDISYFQANQSFYNKDILDNKEYTEKKNDNLFDKTLDLVINKNVFKKNSILNTNKTKSTKTTKKDTVDSEKKERISFFEIDNLLEEEINKNRKKTSISIVNKQIEITNDQNNTYREAIEYKNLKSSDNYNYNIKYINNNDSTIKNDNSLFEIKGINKKNKSNINNKKLNVDNKIEKVLNFNDGNTSCTQNESYFGNKFIYEEKKALDLLENINENKEIRHVSSEKLTENNNLLSFLIKWNPFGCSNCGRNEE